MKFKLIKYLLKAIIAICVENHWSSGYAKEIKQKSIFLNLEQSFINQIKVTVSKLDWRKINQKGF